MNRVTVNMSFLIYNSITEEFFMPKFANPKLKIELVSGTTKRKLTATIDVSFDANEETFIKLVPTIRSKIRCQIMGSDSGFNGGNDHITWMTNQFINKDGQVKFTKTVNASSLDEDTVGADEIIARFSCVNNSPVLFSPSSVDSPEISGDF
jgi:hypothetical protein